MPPFKHRSFVWPTLRTTTVRLRHMPDILIGASVSIDTGRPVVDFQIDGDDEETITPAEARRVAAALVRAADCCDAKSAAARAWRSTPAIEESAPRRTLPARRQTEPRAADRTKGPTRRAP